MRFSVIIPVYNAERWLDMCINSVRSQSYGDFEVLLIDDGSTDGSRAICESYAAKDDRIKLFCKPNGGVSSARNLGLQYAKGEFVVFVDADDMLVPDTLEICNRYADYDIVRFAAIMIYDNGNVRLRKIPKAESRSRAMSLVVSRKTFVGVAAGAFRRSLFEERNIRFDTNIALGEDWQVLALLTHYCKSIKTLPRTYCYIYNKSNESSCTNTLNIGRILQQFDVLRFVQELVSGEYRNEISRTKCLIYNEMVDFFGIKGCVQHMCEARHRIMPLSLHDILVADISLRKKIRLISVWQGYRRVKID